MKTSMLIDSKITKLLQLCRATKDTRYSIRMISVLDGELAATDGRQLVIIHSDKYLDLENGLYILDNELSTIAKGESALLSDFNIPRDVFNDKTDKNLMFKGKYKDNDITYIVMSYF